MRWYELHLFALILRMKVKIAVQRLGTMTVDTDGVIAHIPQEAEFVHFMVLRNLRICSVVGKWRPLVGIVTRGAGNLADICLPSVLIKYRGIPRFILIKANNIVD